MKKRKNEKENICKCAATRHLSPGIYGYVVSEMRQCQACSNSSFEPGKFVRTLMRMMDSMYREGCDCTLGCWDLFLLEGIKRKGTKYFT